MILSQNTLSLLQLSAGQSGDGIAERCAAQFQVIHNGLFLIAFGFKTQFSLKFAMILKTETGLFL